MTSNVLVHNISNLLGQAAAGPKKLLFGGISLWPGRSALVPEEAITAKHRSLLGTYLHIGELPAELREKDVPLSSSAPMTPDEFEKYLHTQSLQSLVALAHKVSPPLRPRLNKDVMVRALVRAYRDPSSLDPEAFFFTRQWTREGLDTFVPVE